MSAMGNMVERIVIGIVTAVVFVLIGVALGPTLLTATATINTTLLTDVPMGSVIVLLATYVGFFYYLGIVLGAIAFVWAVVNRN